MTTDDEILNKQQMLRAIHEAASASGGPITEERAEAIISELERFAIHASLFWAWASDKTVLGWDHDQQTLRFWARGQHPFPLLPPGHPDAVFLEPVTNTDD